MFSKSFGPGIDLGASRADPNPVVHQPVSSSDYGFVVDPAGLGDPVQRTKYPYVTGTSVIGVKYKDGVLLACDTLGAYGATKRYKSVQRIYKVNSRTVVAASGEISDFQYIQRMLDELTCDDYRTDDGIELTPQEVYAYLCRVMYNRRNKFDPLWNSLVVGGVDGEHHFLGMVGMIGTHYVDDHVTTGYANQLARPLLREKHSNDMSFEAARELLHEVLKVCYYRDRTSINKFQLANVTQSGVSVSEPFSLETYWDSKLFADPTKWAIGAW